MSNHISELVFIILRNTLLRPSLEIDPNIVHLLFR